MGCQTSSSAADKFSLLKPDVTYKLEYAYGYRSIEWNNCHFNSQGNAVYNTSTLGVILDYEQNTQKFFGGGEVDTASKESNGAKCHTCNITCLKVSNDR